MLNDLLLVSLANGLWFALGYPVARVLGPHLLSPALAAPPLGLAINAVLVVVFYVFGFRLATAFQLSMILAIPGIGMVVRDRLLHRITGRDCLVLAALLSTTVILLLPKWLGHPDFSVFQSNIGDQFFYLSTAFMAVHHDLAAIQDTDINALVAMGSGVASPYNLMLRPGVALLLGGFASLLHRPVLLVSYAYLAALQLCVFFASVFVSLNLFKLPMQFALWAAMALSIGFHVQYVFDINAWSHLASISLTIICVGLFLLGLLRTPSDSGNANMNVLRAVGYFLSMLVCMTGFLYIYPATLPMVAALTAPIAIWQLFNTSHRSYVFRRLVLFGIAAAIAVILCAPAWPMTVGNFFAQFDLVANTAAYSDLENWWKFGYAYLFGYDNDPNTAFDFRKLQNQSWDHLLFIYTSFIAGIFGIYFMQPATYVYLPGAIAFLLVSLVCLIVLSLRRFWNSYEEVAEDFDPQLLPPVLGGLLLAISAYSTVPLLPLLAPDGSMIAVGFVPGILWKLALATCLTYLIFIWIQGLSYPSSGLVEQRVDRILFAGLAGGIVLVISLVVMARYWAAGKGLNMLSPVMFLAFTGSLFDSKKRRCFILTAVLIYIGTQIGFGVYRSYAAKQDVLAFPLYPYPSDVFRKPMYRWDYAALQKELKGCLRVDVHVDDVYAEMFVEMILVDSGIRWSSRRFVDDNRDGYGFGGGIQKQIENPDCIVSANVHDAQSGKPIIWLRRDLATANDSE